MATKPYTLNLTDPIWPKFTDYHEKNPVIWEYFRDAALAMIRDYGYTHISARHVFEVIRHERAKVTKSDEFNCNNNYTKCYAHKFAYHYPEYKKYFEFRTQGSPKGKKK